MKYHIYTINGKYSHIGFHSFEFAWDFIERYFEKELHNNFWVIGEQNGQASKT